MATPPNKKVDHLFKGPKYIPGARRIPASQVPFPPDHGPVQRTEAAETIRDRRTQGMDFSSSPMAMAPDVAPVPPASSQRAHVRAGMPPAPIAADGLLEVPIGLDGAELDHGYHWQPCVIYDAQTRMVVLKSVTGRTEERIRPEKLLALADHLYAAWRGITAAAAAFDPPSLDEALERR